MGKKEKYLKGVLDNEGFNFQSWEYPIITEQDLRDSDLYDEVERVFIELGGNLNNIKIFHGKWDIQKNGFVIELDEQRHFNRYRLITLKSSFYNLTDNIWHKKYLDYCKDYEDKCIKAASYGGNWTNSSCEKMFGPSSDYGELNDKGPARWKQRAFYDYLKDINAHINNFKILRFSIWDEFTFENNSYTLRKVLNKKLKNALIYYLKSEFLSSNIIFK
jgi:hypothetical protein